MTFPGGLNYLERRYNRKPKLFVVFIYVLCSLHASICIYSTVSSSVKGVTLLPQEDTPDMMYDLEVVCDINPSSTAEYCEVIAHNGVSISGITYKYSTC